MSEFITFGSAQLNTQLSRIQGCLRQLTEEQVWSRLTPQCNSIANLCVHLAGSEYQHIVSGIGGKPFIRERSQEFSIRGGLTPEELGERLQAVRDRSVQELNRLTEQDLDKLVPLYFSREDWREMKGSAAQDTEPSVTRSIRGHLMYTIEHYANHTGQIVLLTKWLGGSL
jgi:uncharacterized damage-inducible protein DinB